MFAIRRRRDQFNGAEPPPAPCPAVSVSGVGSAPPPDNETYLAIDGSGFGDTETDQAKVEIYDTYLEDWFVVTAVAWSAEKITIDVPPSEWPDPCAAARVTNACGNWGEYSLL